MEEPRQLVSESVLTALEAEYDRYLDLDGEEAADEANELLIGSLYAIAANPEIGKPVKGLSESYRRAQFGRIYFYYYINTKPGELFVFMLRSMDERRRLKPATIRRRQSKERPQAREF